MQGMITRFVDTALSKTSCFVFVCVISWIVSISADDQPQNGVNGGINWIQITLWSDNLVRLCGLGFFLPVPQNAFMTLSILISSLAPRKKVRRIHLAGVIVLFLVSAGCQNGAVANHSNDDKSSVPKYGYEVVNTWPHDNQAYTQGLVFHNGKLLESTGQEGRSSLRLVEPETGNVLKKIDVPRPYFAEGITLFKGKIYQLTWQHQLGFIYDAESFAKLGEFSYRSDGWGITNDGSSLIMSDGTNRIRFIDPNNFHVSKTIYVLEGSTPIASLNELEYVHGEIFANVWHKELVARIEPQTGRVVGWIDLTGLRALSNANDGEAVLNGIAYDEVHDRLFVTGKLWPKLYEIRVKRSN
jgi:glutaminyl-peptide cyclotransferase